VDRVTGAPVPDLPVEGEVSGEYLLTDGVTAPETDVNAEEHRRGFAAAWAAKPAEREATPGYTQGYQRAVRLRAEHPDVKITFRGTTDKDGLFDWTVAPAWKEGYQYRIRTTSTQGETCTRVESTYTPSETTGQLLSLVYCDRPVYRAGDSVSFKALLRRRDGEGLQPYDRKEALVEIGTSDRTIYVRSLPVTDFGTVSGSLDLHDEFPRDDYWVRVDNGPRQYRLFKIEDYRKPEFEIAVRSPKRVRAGEAVDLPVLVRRFSGEPLVKARVVLRILMAENHSPARIVDALGWDHPRSRENWGAVAERVLETDGDGLALFRFQTEEKVAARYSATAWVVEESGREGVGSTSFEAAAQVREVLVETDRPIYFPGELAQLRFRLDGAGTARVEERAKVDKPFALTVALREGAGTCEYPVPAEARDLQIGVREGDGWSWTPVAIHIKARSSGAALVDVRADHPLYRVGETAKVEIVSSEPEASVLLLTATGRIHRRQVVRLKDRRAQVPIEVREEDVPNVHLVALTVKNDHVGKAAVSIDVPPLSRFLTVEVTTDQTEYRPGQECRASLKVRDAQGRPVPDCELSLGVVDESIYAIQQDLTPDLREYFHRYSRPLRVEESFFYKERMPPFTIWKAPVFVRGTLSLYESMGVGAGSAGRYGSRFGGRENLVARGGGTSATTPRLPRSDFRDTAYWSAHLKTGADGTATATFPFPDNLTKFRFTARGITRAHQVGEVRHQAVVRKPFFVRLAAPRVLQEGNVVAVSGLVHNQTDQAQTVRVSLRTSCPILSTTAPATIPMLPGDSSRVEYLLSADSPAGAELTFAAESDSGQNDAVRIRIPGRRHGSPFLEGRSGAVAAGAPKEEVFRIPAQAIPATVTLRLDFDAGIHTAITGALDPLIEYPYGCVEQTMSRFLPAVAARRALGEVPERFREKLPAVLASGLQRLYLLQQPDGSWGWWRGDSRNAPLSAYVLYGLSTCKKAGVVVDRAAADRAAKFLLERVSQSVFNQPHPAGGRLPLRTPLDGRIYELLALAEYHSAWGLPAVSLKQLIGTMADRSEGASAADETVLALAAARVGMKDVADVLGRRAERHAPADVATASFLLQLQAARGGDLAPTLRYLLSRRSGRGWASTIESAYAILGLAAALERPSPAMDLPPGRVEIRVNGQPVQELTLRGAADPSFDGRVFVPAPPAGWGEKAVVTISFEGQGSAFYTASLEALLGGEDRAPVSSGLEIRREYYERAADGDGWHPVDGAISPGRTVLVLLRLDTPVDRDYVMVSDPRPDGFEPLDLRMDALRGTATTFGGLTDRVDLDREWPSRLDEFRRTVRGDAARESAWTRALLREIIERKKFVRVSGSRELSFPSAAVPANVEHRDDRTIFFLNSLPAGSSGLWYFARAEHPGRLHALAPRAEGMYEPELHASGAESRLTVADGALIPVPGRVLENAPGVDGLLEVLPLLGQADPDAILTKVPSQPRIGELLGAVCGEPALRAWLSAMPATRQSGRGLGDRIDAARRDLATRSLLLETLAGAPREWLPLLEAALADDGLTELVLKGGDVVDPSSADNVLLWTAEDREWRVSVLAVVQRLRGSARVRAATFPRLGMERVLRAAGASAPAGEALLQWKLAQKGRFGGGTLQELAARFERDLSIRIRIKGVPEFQVGEFDWTVGRILDQILVTNKLCYRVQGDEILIGPLEELLR
jgi:hypothetical protein